MRRAYGGSKATAIAATMAIARVTARCAVTRRRVRTSRSRPIASSSTRRAFRSSRTSRAAMAPCRRRPIGRRQRLRRAGSRRANSGGYVALLVLLLGGFGRSGAGSLGQRLIEIGDDIVDRLDADAQPDHVRARAGGHELFRRQLPMGRRRRVDDQRARVADIGEVAEELDTFHNLYTGFVAPFDAEREYRAGAARHVFLVVLE